MRQLLTQLAKINAALCGAARNLAGMLLIAMVAIVILQIFFRYVLNDSLSWTEEVSKTMMVWTAFLVAPWAYRVGANVRIEIFVEQCFHTVDRMIESQIDAEIEDVADLFVKHFGRQTKLWDVCPHQPARRVD